MRLRGVQRALGVCVCAMWCMWSYQLPVHVGRCPVQAS